MSVLASNFGSLASECLTHVAMGLYTHVKDQSADGPANLGRSFFCAVNQIKVVVVGEACEV